MILVDFSNVVWACHFADPDNVLENLKTKLRSIEMVVRVPWEQFVFVKDNRAVAKYELWPQYKAGRVKPDVDPRPSLENWLKQQGCRFAQSLDQEADDVIATLAYHGSRDGFDVVVVSNDKDLWQLLELPGVTVWDHIAREFVRAPRMLKAFGTQDPRHIRLIKTMWGDVSDAIPNAVPRMQKQLMPVILESDGTLGDFWTRLEDTPLTGRCRELLIQGLKGIRVNYILTGLKQDCEVIWE